MTRRNLWYSVALVLSVLLVAVGVYRQVDARRDPAPAKNATTAQRALVPAPLTVSLSAASDRRTAAVGATTFLAVNAAGATISEVRVYDGDALVGVKRFTPARSNRVSVQFGWPAVRAGTHVLHAEATGADVAQVGHSAPLRLRAAEGLVPAASVLLPGNGRTPTELAAATGVAVGDLVYRGRNGARVPKPPAFRPLADGVVAQAPLDRITAAPPKTAPVAAPGRTAITAVLDGCRATVTPVGDGPVSVYEMTGGGAGFTLRGSASPGAPYATGELTPGTHVFVAGPAGAPADSTPVSVQAPSTCLADVWSGNAALFDGELTLPKSEPRVWVYLGVDGKPFQRIPATGSVPASFGTADLATVMPTLDGSRVRMEVWRPGKTAAAPATLVARSESTGTDAVSVPDLLGGSPAVTLRATNTNDNPVELGKQTLSVRFTWQTSSLIPDGMVWQVLGRPLPTTDHNTAPPVLLATGYSPQGDGGGVNLSSDQAGTFEIPAEVLLAGRPAADQAGTLLSKVPTPSMTELVKPGSSFGVTPLKPPGPGQIPTLDAGIVPIPIGDVYVRVLPVNGESVVGDASNTVAVTLPPLDDKSAVFKIVSSSFDPGRAANGQLAGCVRITGTPTTSPGSSYLGSVYTQDRTWCQSDFPPKKGRGCTGWCQIANDVGSLVSYVGKVWDYIASAYNTVVETLITVIAKFNPFCATASVASAISSSPYADSAASGCEAIGEVVGSVVVSVVLSSFGLPARLPSSKELADVAQGDLTGIAVAYLESIGVPCSKMKVDAATVKTAGAAGVDVPAGAKNAQGDVDVCAAMIQKAVGEIRGQVKAASQAEIANATGLPVPPEPQSMIREPRGQYQGATVQLVARPVDPNTPRTARCAAAAVGDIRDWKTGLYGADEPRDIQQGHGSVRFHLFDKLAGREPWSVELRMAPIQDLTASEIISVQVYSTCFTNPAPASFPRVPLRPALDYWYPGQAE
ncbi:MAG: hypothetical protein NTV23_11660 [Propionibacteriales bacterium]|nr:hypothetical protein [Propionibacteriales bacterium]